MVAKGDRVRMVGVMRDDPDPIPVGVEGTVTRVSQFSPGQIGVKWDNGRSLILLEEDPFIVVGKADDADKEGEA